MPGLPYIADFKVEGLGLVEIAGMVGHARYDAKLAKKKRAYKAAGVEVSWLTREDVNKLFEPCPVELRFRPRFCESCGERVREIVNGMCRPCNRKVWGETQGEEATCEQCEEAFTRSAGSPDARFCSHGCYARSLELVWPSWDDLDARLRASSARQVALELGVEPSALYMRLRRRRERDPQAPHEDGRRKVTEDDVQEMRRLHKEGVSQSDLHRRFGIGRVAVHQIIHRKTWQHVP